MKLEEVLLALKAVSGGASAASQEDEHLDFKQDPATVVGRGPADGGNAASRLIEVLVEAVVCFANAPGGGWVVLGVNDKESGPAAFTGTQADLDDVRRKIFNKTTPHLPVVVHELHHDGARLLCLEVHEGLDLYTDSRGRATTRVGDACEALSEEARRTLAHERRNPDPTDQPSRRAAVHLDPLAIEQARQLLRDLPDARRDLALLPVEDLLRRLGLVEEGGELKVAAEILFCRPGRPTVSYLYRTSPGAEPSADRLSLPMILGHRALLDRIAARRRTELGRLQLPSGQEIAIPDYPELAIDEAVTNAMAHRAYGPDEPVVVDHSPQVLRVWSPGGLPPGVRKEQLLRTVSRPRNAALMNAARILGIAEATSRGVDRMYREMIKTGRAAPEIEVDDFSVEVVFTSGAPNQAFAYFVSQLAPELRENVQVLLVLAALCERRTIDAVRAGALLQAAPPEARRALEWMSAPPVGLIELAGSRGGQRSTWRLATSAQAGLGTAITYRTRRREGDEKIVSHVREYGWVTNRTVRNLFDLDVQQARAIISDMRDRGLLLKDPEGPERGPGVRWLPGQKL